MGYILGTHWKCEGLNESDICSVALPRLGVKLRRGFHIDPANVEREEEDESFRYLQYMKFWPICTVFLI